MFEFSVIFFLLNISGNFNYFVGDDCIFTFDEQGVKFYIKDGIVNGFIKYEEEGVLRDEHLFSFDLQ